MDRLAIIRTFVDCDPVTGDLSWRVGVSPQSFRCPKAAARYPQKYAGRPVKLHRINSFGHVAFRVPFVGRGFNVLAHRAVWAVLKGCYPSCDIDHVNNDPADNRPSNLRLATRGQNVTNQKRRKAGLRGAYQADGGVWFSAVWDGARLRHLGMFPTEQAAHDAWAQAKADIAGAFFNPGHPSVFD